MSEKPDQSAEDKKMQVAAKSFVQMYEAERNKVVAEARELNVIDRNTLYGMLLKAHVRISDLEHAVESAHVRISDLEHAVESFREWAKKVEKPAK